MNPSRAAAKVLPYVAGILFAGMYAAAIDVSSQLSIIEDSGLRMYHAPVAVKVFWFESKACMVLPPDGYISNCNYLGGIRAITLLSVLLAVVLLAYAILRKRSVETLP